MIKEKSAMPKRLIHLLLALACTLLAASPLLAQDATSTPTPTSTSTTTATAAATQVPAAASLLPGYEYYTVQLGDTLFRISVRFRTNVRHLADINGIVNPSLIFAGQRIQVPSVGQATPTPAGTAAPTTTAGPTNTPA